MNISFPDDAGDMLADLHRILPQSYDVTDSEAVSFSGASGGGEAEKTVQPPISFGADDGMPETEPETEDDDDEIYEEEYDDELFDIFIQHLKENISLLMARIKDLSRSENKLESLDKCIEYIDGLRSSANYMDYKKLTRFYEKWKEDIRAAQEKITRREVPLFRGADMQSGMKACISDIIRRFPNHDLGVAPADVSAESDIVQEAPGEQADEFLAIDMSELNAEDLSSLGVTDEEISGVAPSPEPGGEETPEEMSAIRIPAELEEKAEPVVRETSEDFAPIEIPPELEEDLLSEEVSSVREETETHHEEETIADRPASDYQGLFEELDEAFDPAGDQPPESEPELYQGDFEEKLFSQSQVPAQPVSPAESPAAEPKEVKTEPEKNPSRIGGGYENRRTGCVRSGAAPGYCTGS